MRRLEDSVSRHSSGHHRFGGFSSRLLAEQLSTQTASPETRFDVFPGVVLFVDVVNSTSMTDRVAATGPDGAERLGETLNDYFSRVIDIVASHGGDVVSIDGDTIIGLWPSGEDPGLQARLAAGAAFALRNLGALWPVEPATPLRHRLTLAAGQFSAIILSGPSKRRFHVLAGAPLRTVGLISHLGKAGDIVVDRGIADLLSEQAAFEPIAESCGDQPYAARLNSLQNAARQPGPALLPVAPGPPPSFLPHIVVLRSESGLEAWMREFRVVSLVYARLGEPEAADAPAIQRLQSVFDIVAETAEALDVEVFSVVADEKGATALVVFGLPPFSAENNASHAVGFAARIREKVSALGVAHSIGVASGRVFCGLVGNATRREYVLNGPVMNYGVRLMQAAKETVLCDAETASAAEGRFSFADAEQIPVKGRARQLAVRRLAEARAALPVSVSQQSLLLGRDAEVADLGDRLDRLARGEGGLVILEGEPGAGKSRLLYELRLKALFRGFLVVQTGAHAIERATAYFVFRGVFQQLLRRSGDRDDASLAVLRARYAEALAGSGLDQKAAVIEDVMPIGVENRELAAQIKGSARRAGVEDIVVALAARQAAGRPHVILVDDLHWIDALSADLLLAMRRRLPNVLIVATSRPLDPVGAPHGAKVIQRASRRIPVARIDAGATAQMICGLLNVRSAPRRLVDFVYGQSEGLPIHIDQLVMSLLEHGLIEAKDGQCRVPASDLATAAVPHKLRDIVVSRIDDLGQADQLVAKVASVIGRVFELDVLRAIYPESTDARSLEASVRRLAAAGILLSESARDGSPHVFRHVIIQEATYELLSFAQRRCLHRKLVEFIEERYSDALEAHYAELAHHCEHAGDAAKAVDFRLSAAGLAIRRYANEDGLMHVERAERLAKRARLTLFQRQLAEAAFVRGEALHALSRFSEAEKQFQECMRLNGMDRPAALTMMAISVIREAARQAAHRIGLARMPKTDELREQARLSAHLNTRFAEHAYFLGDSLELVRGTLTALNRAEQVGSVTEMIGGYGGLAIGLGTAGLHSLARFYRQRAIAVADNAGEMHDRGFGRLLAGVYSYQAGDWEAARMHFDRGAEIFEKLGDRFRLQSCRVVDCHRAIAAGDHARARAGLNEFGEAAEAIENGPVRAWALAGLGVLDMIEGRAPWRTIRRMELAADLHLHRAESLLCGGLKAAALLRAGDEEAAERTAAEQLESMREVVCTMGIALFSVSAVAEVYLSLLGKQAVKGVRDPALALKAEQACRAVRKYALRTRICRARRHLYEGQLALVLGRPARAANRFKRGLDWAERLRMPLDEALAQLGLAQALGETESGRQCRDLGASLLNRLGARPWILLAGGACSGLGDAHSAAAA